MTTKNDGKKATKPTKTKTKAVAMGAVEAAAKVRTQKEKLLSGIVTALAHFRDAVGLGYHHFDPRQSYSGGYPSPAEEALSVTDGQRGREIDDGPEAHSDSPAPPISNPDAWRVDLGSLDRRITSVFEWENHSPVDADDELQECADSIVDYSNLNRLAPGVPLTMLAIDSKSRRDRACAVFAKAIYQLPVDCELIRPLVGILRATESANWENVASGRCQGPTPLIEQLLDDIETERRLISGTPPGPSRKNNDWVAKALLIVEQNTAITDSEIASRCGVHASTVGRSTLFQNSKKVILAQHAGKRVTGMKYDGTADAAV